MKKLESILRGLFGNTAEIPLLKSSPERPEELLMALVESEQMLKESSNELRDIVEAEKEQVKELAVYAGMHLDILPLEELDKVDELMKGFYVGDGYMRKAEKYFEYWEYWIALNKRGELKVVRYKHVEIYDPSSGEEESAYMEASNEAPLITEWEAAMVMEEFEEIHDLIQAVEVSEMLYKAAKKIKATAEAKVKAVEQRKARLASRRLR